MQHLTQKIKLAHYARSVAVAAVALTCVLLLTTISYAEIKFSSDGDHQIIEIRHGSTTAKLCPSQGANVFSIEVAGHEFLRQPESDDKIGGVSCGVPVLYPTPNRVKDAKFTFDGTEVTWKPNAGGNFIHGLVNRHSWKVVNVSSTGSVQGNSSTVVMKADFNENSELHQQFPFAHALTLSVKVSDGRVRWTYEVDNSSGQQRIPFGFALHPYFTYQGSRESTYLTIPATHWMHSEQKLPSGKLVPAKDLDFPLGKPMSLAGTKFDDVFFGMNPKAPTTIDFRDADCSVEIAASEAFTHLVVWTPQANYFGIESQTCSTDAHNLHAAGFEKAAHLQICEPGKTATGWVEYRVTAPADQAATGNQP